MRRQHRATFELTRDSDVAPTGRAHYLLRDVLCRDRFVRKPTMSDTDHLKLAALDEDDLAILSTYVQDAVMKVADLVYLPTESRFVIAMNRFIWEAADGRRRGYERRRAALTFDRVQGVKTSGIRRDQSDAVLDLLAVDFDATDAPAGAIHIIFAGGGAVRLEVECIEARLADLGAAWATTAKPRHDLDTNETKSGG